MRCVPFLKKKELSSQNVQNVIGYHGNFKPEQTVIYLICDGRLQFYVRVPCESVTNKILHQHFRRSISYEICTIPEKETGIVGECSKCNWLSWQFQTRIENYSSYL